MDSTLLFTFPLKADVTPFRCSVVSVTSFGDETMSRIFTVLVDWWMRKAHYPPAVTKLRSPMVSATLDIYQVKLPPFRSVLLGSVLLFPSLFRLT